MLVPYFCKRISSLLFNNETLIFNALKCLEKRLRYSTATITSSENAKQYLRLQLGGECNETFSVLFLDKQHRFLAFEKLFNGTIDEIKLYPRVIVQRALDHNAAAIILSHNHPSGDVEPSNADKSMTQTITNFLRIIDIDVLDHIIVSFQDSFSFADNRLM